MQGAYKMIFNFQNINFSLSPNDQITSVIFAIICVVHVLLFEFRNVLALV
jgi:hypothetical protein